MRMFFIGFLVLVLGASKEDKENSCFLLVNFFINELKSEVKKFCEKNLGIEELSVRRKMEEEGFFKCVENIKDEQVQMLRNERGGKFGKYEELVNVDLSRYLESGFKVTAGFTKLRKEIGGRILKDKDIFRGL